MSQFPRLSAKRLEGLEPFRCGGRPLEFNVLEFWQWLVSDLVSNATRGRLAEFLVAKALGVCVTAPRDEWAACDLLTPEGVKVEVKSSAYLQSWFQKRCSSIIFSVSKARAWDPETSQLAACAGREADVYVFALLAHKEKLTLDPFDLDQWEFYVLPTTTLNERARSQHSITLQSLLKLEAGPVRYADLRARVLSAAKR